MAFKWLKMLKCFFFLTYLHCITHILLLTLSLCESCLSSYLCLCAIKGAWSSSHHLPALLVCPIIFFAYQSTSLLKPPSDSAPGICFFQYSVSVAASLETSSGALWWSVGFWCCRLSTVFIFVLHWLPAQTLTCHSHCSAIDHPVTQPQPCTSSHYSLPIIYHHNAIWQFVFRVQNLQPLKVTSEIFEGHFLFFCNLKFLSSKQSILELCFICLAPELETIKPPCELQS